MVSVSVICCYLISHPKPTELVEFQSFILLKICKFCRGHLTGQLARATWYELGEEDSLSKRATSTAGKLASAENRPTRRLLVSFFLHGLLGFSFDKLTGFWGWAFQKNQVEAVSFLLLSLRVPTITYTIVPSPGPSWQIDGETVETVADFILGGSKITVDGDFSHEENK